MPKLSSRQRHWKDKDKFILIKNIFHTRCIKVNKLDVISYRIKILKTVHNTKIETLLWETIIPWQVISQRTNCNTSSFLDVYRLCHKNWS